MILSRLGKLSCLRDQSVIRPDISYGTTVLRIQLGQIVLFSILRNVLAKEDKGSIADHSSAMYIGVHHTLNETPGYSIGRLLTSFDHDNDTASE